MNEEEDKKPEMNLLPRTLRGVGGHFYIDHPGLTYPDAVLHAAEGMNRQTGKPYESAPSGCISSEEAAKILKISTKSARIQLHRLNTKYCMVREDGRRLQVYWYREAVEKLSKTRATEWKRIPVTMIDANEAMELLGVQRSSVFRYVQQGKLHEHRHRVKTRRGLRTKLFYDKDEVLRLAEHLMAVRQYQQQIRRCNSEYCQEVGQEAQRRENDSPGDEYEANW